jgi:hypothetical protein
MTLPLPADTGLYNNNVLTVDGQDLLDKVSSGEGGRIWKLDMKPGQRSVVKLAYDSRGLEYLRYIPRRMIQTGHYRVTVHVVGIPPKGADGIDWPIGSMPPNENRDKLEGDTYDLTWNLDNAMTSYDIGVKLPEAKQPAYYFASLLEQAPIGLVLLLAMLILPRLIGGYRINLACVILILAAYYLFYTFMGNLADLVPGFATAFIIAALVLGLIVAVFRLADSSSRFLGAQDILWFVALMVLYPLAIIDTERTNFWMQVFYVGQLLYVCLLTLKLRIAPALREAPATA